MSKDKISISKIEIDINGKKFKLSMDEAKSLKKILNELFVEVDISNPFIPYPVPYYIPDRWPRRTWECDPWRVTYTGTTDSGNTLYLNTTGGY